MVDSRDIRVAILGAVAREVEALSPSIERVEPFTLHGQRFLAGSCGGCSLLVGTTGLGKVNAAITVAALLERFDVGEVWNVGSAGAYADGPLRVGDVLFTTETILGDEGILSREGVRPLRSIGIPTVARDNEEFYDSFPLGGGSTLAASNKTPPGLYRLDEKLGPASARVLTAVKINPADSPFAPGESGRISPPGGVQAPDPLPPEDSAGRAAFRLFHGPSLTVSMASGDMETAHARFTRHGALAENMEGSAIAQACFRFGVPVLEVRGISNVAGNRDKNDWRIKTAIAHCHGIVMNWLGAA